MTVLIDISSNKDRAPQCKHLDYEIGMAERVAEAKDENGEDAAIVSELSHTDTPLVQQGKKRARDNSPISSSVSGWDDSGNILVDFIVSSSHLSPGEGVASSSSSSALFTQVTKPSRKRLRRGVKVQGRVESSNGADAIAATGSDDGGAGGTSLEPLGSLSSLPSVSVLIHYTNPLKATQVPSPLAYDESSSAVRIVHPDTPHSIPSTNSLPWTPSPRTPPPRTPPSRTSSYFPELSAVQAEGGIQTVGSPGNSSPVRIAFGFARTSETNLLLSTVFKPTQMSSPFTTPPSLDGDKSCERGSISNTLVVRSGKLHPSPPLDIAGITDGSSQYSSGLDSEDLMRALYAVESDGKTPSKDATNS